MKSLSTDRPPMAAMPTDVRSALSIVVVDPCPADYLAALPEPQPGVWWQFMPPAPAMPSALPVCGRSISGSSTPGSPTCRVWTCAACCGTRSAPRSTSSPIVTRPTKSAPLACAAPRYLSASRRSLSGLPLRRTAAPPVMPRGCTSAEGHSIDRSRQRGCLQPRAAEHRRLVRQSNGRGGVEVRSRRAHRTSVPRPPATNTAGQAGSGVGQARRA